MPNYINKGEESTELYKLPKTGKSEFNIFATVLQFEAASRTIISYDGSMRSRYFVSGNTNQKRPSMYLY